MEEDRVHENSNGSSQGLERPEPVRSRWSPKPDQIMIMESIFNTGLVNPSKEETVRIRKQLEKFGSVADANVFYWFQNRRSRSRRRQRQIKALMANNPDIPSGVNATGAIPCEHTSPYSFGSFVAVVATSLGSRCLRLVGLLMIMAPTITIKSRSKWVYKRLSKCQWFLLSYYLLIIPMCTTNLVSTIDVLLW